MLQELDARLKVGVPAMPGPWALDCHGILESARPWKVQPRQMLGSTRAVHVSARAKIAWLARNGFRATDHRFVLKCAMREAVFHSVGKRL